VSLESFQRAFADLVASPQKCLELRHGEHSLDEFQLTELERRRLMAMVSHAGMSHNCSLYRANRLTPIARSLPQTCVRLGSKLVLELERFWELSPDTELQFKRESERFALFLLNQLNSDKDEEAELIEVIRAELAVLNHSFSAPELRTH
jgi:hypothetical protein